MCRRRPRPRPCAPTHRTSPSQPPNGRRTSRSTRSCGRSCRPKCGGPPPSKRCAIESDLHPLFLVRIFPRWGVFVELCANVYDDSDPVIILKSNRLRWLTLRASSLSICSDALFFTDPVASCVRLHLLILCVMYAVRVCVCV